MTDKSAPLSLPQRCWGRWRAAPDGVWKAALRRQEVGAAGIAMRGVVLGAGRGDGRAATFPSILTEVRAGAASEHDESGNDALARFAQSSDRRAWLSQANTDWSLFCGFRLPCAQNRRRSGRSHTRDGGSEDQGRGKGRMVSTGGVSRSSLSRRTHHRRASGRHRAHPGGDARDLKRNSEQARPCAETWQEPEDIRVTRRTSSSGPHPIRRFATPSPAELGKESARRRWDHK
jgi:hypothetical protein